MNVNVALCLSRPGTSIAAAVGGAVLFLILLGLLVFYLRRQKQLKRKETLRRILQEHEVGVGTAITHGAGAKHHGGCCSKDRI